MNKAIIEEISALIGEVIDFSGDGTGGAIDRCIRARVMVDIFKPLLRWTTVSFGGVLYKVLFRYEKLADFCYLCGRLNYLEKHCVWSHPDGLRYYGP